MENWTSIYGIINNTAKQTACLPARLMLSALRLNNNMYIRTAK
jgi:hypothetical protein